MLLPIVHDDTYTMLFAYISRLLRLHYSSRRYYYITLLSATPLERAIERHSAIIISLATTDAIDRAMSIVYCFLRYAIRAQTGGTNVNKNPTVEI